MLKNSKVFLHTLNSNKSKFTSCITGDDSTIDIEQWIEPNKLMVAMYPSKDDIPVEVYYLNIPGTFEYKKVVHHGTSDLFFLIITTYFIL